MTEAGVGSGEIFKDEKKYSGDGCCGSFLRETTRVFFFLSLRQLLWLLHGEPAYLTSVSATGIFLLLGNGTSESAELTIAREELKGLPFAVLRAFWAGLRGGPQSVIGPRTTVVSVQRGDSN